MLLKNQENGKFLLIRGRELNKNLINGLDNITFQDYCLNEEEQVYTNMV